MVTKRARLWLTRGTTITVLLVALALVVAAWVQGSSIEGDWLTVRSTSDEGSAVVERIGDGTVLLADGDDLERPGIWAVRNRDGWVRVGAVVATGPEGVTRELLAVRGTIRPGSGVSFTRSVWEADDPPVELEDVVFDGPLGEHAAWVMGGTDDTWVVLVHGNGADRTEAFRILPTLLEAGLPAIVPAYRNDVGAPPSDGEHHGFGRGEWRDIDAAVDFALASGARDLVLVGYGSGGSIVGTFLYESLEADRVVGVILDAPILSLGTAVDEAWRPAQVPGFMVGWAKAVATFRFGVDWSELDHVDRVDEWEPPVLILHGRDDDEAPLRASTEFATAAIDRTLLLTFPGAPHGASWNTDPARYESAVAGFLTEHAVGESEFEPEE